MPETGWLCFNRKYPEDETDCETSGEESDDEEGYIRLDGDRTKDNNEGENESGGENLHSSRKKGQKPGESQPYAKVDKKANRLSRKLRRKEKKARLYHLLRVTWKWCKRGFQASAPRLSATFNLAPSAAVPVVYNVQKARAGEQRRKGMPRL